MLGRRARLRLGTSCAPTGVRLAGVGRSHLLREPPRPERRVLFESLGVSVVDFRCRAHVEPEGPEEPNPTHSIVLVRRGLFRRTRRDETLLADANHVLLFNAAEPSRFSHPSPGGDDCTILTVETHRALELVARHAPGHAEDPQTPFRLGHGISSPRVARIHYELLALLRKGETTLVLDDALSALAQESVRAVYGMTAARRAVPSARARRRRREIVEAVSMAIHGRLDSPPGLGELARALDCSPFHLSHVFRHTTGVSLRRYVQQLRARIAADRLAGGAPDLTELALDLGYTDHSHFTNSFRREWGLPPSRFRARLGSRRRSRKKFQAAVDGPRLD
jgi:AraC-like DNA-binding protein